MADMSLFIEVQCYSQEEYAQFLADAQVSYANAEIDEYESELKFVINRLVEA